EREVVLLGHHELSAIRKRRLRPARNVQLRRLAGRWNHAAVELRRLRDRRGRRAGHEQRRQPFEIAHGVVSVLSVSGSVTTVLLLACDASSVFPTGTLLNTMRALVRYLFATRLMSAAVTACSRGKRTRK